MFRESERELQLLVYRFVYCRLSVLVLHPGAQRLERTQQYGLLGEDMFIVTGLWFSSQHWHQNSLV